MVSMTPVLASTRRMQWLNVSDKYKLPARSNATSNGLSRQACAAGPPSPEWPACPVPTTVEMIHDIRISPIPRRSASIAQSLGLHQQAPESDDDERSYRNHRGRRRDADDEPARAAERAVARHAGGLPRGAAATRRRSGGGRDRRHRRGA